MSNVVMWYNLVSSCVPAIQRFTHTSYPRDQVFWREARTFSASFHPRAHVSHLPSWLASAKEFWWLYNYLSVSKRTLGRLFECVCWWELHTLIGIRWWLSLAEKMLSRRTLTRCSQSKVDAHPLYQDDDCYLLAIQRRCTYVENRKFSLEQNCSCLLFATHVLIKDYSGNVHFIQRRVHSMFAKSHSMIQMHCACATTFV